jgi:putative cell wall-binding protein
MVLLLATPVAAFGSGTISGTVSTEGGVSLLLRGARVEAFEGTPEGPDPSKSALTDASGDYTMNVTDIGSGDYLLRVWKPGYIMEDTSWFPVSGPVTKDVKLARDPVLTERLADNDRYSTAVKVARERYTSSNNPTKWWGVRHIVIASGEDRAAADPLAAAGLCGVYNAPLFLVTSDGVPSDVKQAINEICLTATNTFVHIVGGPVSVPDDVYDEIAAIGTSQGQTFAKRRVLATGDRYDLAAAVALEIKAMSGGNPPWALIANGADSEKFFDPLALSTVASSRRFPILLVSENGIPAATRNVLDDLGNPDLVIGGGPATVSSSVMTQLDSTHGTVERWSGADRYKTAIDIANKAMAKGWLDGDSVAVAAKLPDALTGGATIGRFRGVLVITDGQALTSSTGSWLSSKKGDVWKCYVIGGPVSVTESVKNDINSRLD